MQPEKWQQNDGWKMTFHIKDMLNLAIGVEIFTEDRYNHF